MGETLACDVAIVGGGPAGLGAAIELRARGVAHVVVLEREPEAGGVPRHCAHPPYGLREFGRLMTGPAYARRLRAIALHRGVDVRSRHSVVSLGQGGILGVATPDGPLTVSARRVVLATGARETPRSARMVSGERPLGILNTGMLQACLAMERCTPFLRPLIVGTELVGLSALWTCLKHGIRPAAVIEDGAEPTARWPLGLLPRLLGIPVHYRTYIADIEGSPRVEQVTIVTADGRETRVQCDGVLFTGQFLPEASLIPAGPMQKDRATGGPAVDQYGRCPDPVYFAAGNVLRPIETAGWCHGEGRHIAAAVARDLTGLLPAPTPCLKLHCGRGVRFIVPQAICHHSPAFGLRHIQLRASHAVKGVLRMRQAGKLIWSRRLSTRPERRILVPLLRAWDFDAGDIVVSIDANQ
jgi:NADPH-dependent 2,4-dienoyl-CoA reductase/sulfur reductase-like enzyme